MLDLDGPVGITGLSMEHTFVGPLAPQERLFVVVRSGKKHEKVDEVRAGHALLTERGDLVFRTGGHLVRAIAAGTWSDLEEGEPED
jgi:hypothetical protein